LQAARLVGRLGAKVLLSVKIHCIVLTMGSECMIMPR
jgi:hypothetical protein